MGSGSDGGLGPLHTTDINEALTQIASPARTVFSLGLLATSVYFLLPLGATSLVAVVLLFNYSPASSH